MLPLTRLGRVRAIGPFTYDVAEPPETAVVAVPVMVKRLDEVVIKFPSVKTNCPDTLSPPPVRITPFALLIVTSEAVRVAGTSLLVITGAVAVA